MPKPQYGYEHQKLRKEWKPKVDTGTVHCHHYPECTRPEDTLIHPGEKWHLEHHPVTGEYLGPGHAICNLGTSRQWKEIATQQKGDYQWFT